MEIHSNTNICVCLLANSVESGFLALEAPLQRAREIEVCPGALDGSTLEVRKHASW